MSIKLLSKWFDRHRADFFEFLQRASAIVLSALLVGTSIAPAQSTDVTATFFTPGNLVLSRSVYAGTSSTVTVGQALPPVCGTGATCKGKATNDGTYPGVWGNDIPDSSFGVTSPIYLDQITTGGTLVSTLPVPTGQVVTSFSSKSELALNLSTDGNYITFMGYNAPVNALDVSNSNTPGVIDPTDPVGGTNYYRLVAQVDANGNLITTATNAYSGNNGRAVILANGYYYTAGNAGNGGNPQPAGVVQGAGNQLVTPNTVPGDPVLLSTFSVTQYGYPADKVGKDTNFRGLTIFNNTLYTTKGSGGNGIDSVYQIGTAGTLPTPGNSTLPVGMTVLPGLPTNLAGTATTFPFGIWFANANTLYVADEGDGTAANAAKSTTAGLQKWVLVNGTWQLAYVLQNGLKLGQQYSIPGYPTSLNPATDGLRNITGRVNSDGTATIWGVTSTISNNGDQGADPNQLVSITDVVANTNPAAAVNEQFTIIRAAGYGEVLRGVSFTPGTVTPTAPANISVVAGGLLYSRRTLTYTGSVTITNNGTTAITGPYYVELTSLSANATLIGGTTRGGFPAVQVLASGSTLQPGQQASATVSFSDPSNAVITYTPVVGQ